MGNQFLSQDAVGPPCSVFRVVYQKDKTQLKAGNYNHLRIPDSYDAKIAKICYLGTLWPVIQLKDHIFEIRQKAFLKRWFIN